MLSFKILLYIYSLLSIPSHYILLYNIINNSDSWSGVVWDGLAPRPSQTAPDHPRPFQTIPDHSRPSQTAPDHPRPRQTIPDHPRPPQTIPDHPRPRQTTPDHARPRQTIPDHPRQHGMRSPQRASRKAINRKFRPNQRVLSYKTVNETVASLVKYCTVLSRPIVLIK